MKLLIVYYSMYGHIYALAKAAAEGAKQVPGCEVAIKKVPETLSKEILEKMGATQFQKTTQDIPVCTNDDLAAADAIIFGTPSVSEICADKCASSLMLPEGFGLRTR